jgi:hypothetical protein
MTTTNHTSPSGEDAANGAIGEREAFLKAYAMSEPFRAHQAGEVFDKDWHSKRIWDAAIAFARAALAAEKVAAEPESSCDPADICAGCRCKYNVYAAPQQPAQSAEQDERAQLDVSVLARLSAQIFDCPLNPTISKFARAVEANVRAASTQSTATQPAQKQGALTLEEVFLRWSEWTTELGEAISRKNIDGFVSDLRALLAAQPVSGGKS